MGRATNLMETLILSQQVIIESVEKVGNLYNCKVTHTLPNDRLVVGDVVRYDYNGKYFAIVSAIANDVITFNESEFIGSTRPTSGQVLFRFGHITTKNRQGTLVLSQTDENSYGLTVYDGVKDGVAKGREVVKIGFLGGIIDPDFGALEGWGSYLRNAKVSGQLIAKSGSNVYTKYETNTIIDLLKAEIYDNLGATEELKDLNERLNDAIKKSNEAMDAINDYSSDGILTLGEKESVRREWNMIKNEYGVTIKQVAPFKIDTKNFERYFRELRTYILPILAEDGNSDINRETFRVKFSNYYNEKMSILSQATDALNSLNELTNEQVKELEELSKDNANQAKEITDFVNSIVGDNKITGDEMNQLYTRLDELDKVFLVLTEKSRLYYTPVEMIDPINPYFIFKKAHEELFAYIDSLGNSPMNPNTSTTETTPPANTGGTVENKPKTFDTTFAIDVDREYFNEIFSDYFEKREELEKDLLRITKEQAEKALGILLDMANDGKITPQEKLALLSNWYEIKGTHKYLKDQSLEYPDNNAIKNQVLVYDAMLQNLKLFLKPIINDGGELTGDMSATTSVDPNVYNKAFLDYYQSKELLASMMGDNLAEYLYGDDGLQKILDDIMKQVDGNYEVHFNYNAPYIPSLVNPPANTWTPAEYPEKVGDVFYNVEDGTTYVFAKKPDGTYVWIQDSDGNRSVIIAQMAKDLADSKVKIFVVQPKPPYNLNDIWVKDKEMYFCVTAKKEGETFALADWTKELKYDNTTEAINGGITHNGYIKSGRTGIVGKTGSANKNKELRIYAGADVNIDAYPLGVVVDKTNWLDDEGKLKDDPTVPKFVVLDDGTTYMKDAILSGFIYATGGRIGNIEILNEFEVNLSGDRVQIRPKWGTENQGYMTIPTTEPYQYINGVGGNIKAGGTPLWANQGYLMINLDKTKAGNADNADRWGGNLFTDWMNQPVKTTNNVVFAKVTAKDGEFTNLNALNNLIIPSYNATINNGANSLSLNGSYLQAGAVKIWAGNSDRWGGYLFDDWMNQPVKTTSNVTFANVNTNTLTAATGNITNANITGSLIIPTFNNTIHSNPNHLSKNGNYLNLGRTKIWSGNADMWDSHVWADYMNQAVRSIDSPKFEGIGSSSYLSGFTGHGYKLGKDANGNYLLEVDRMIVRKDFSVYELIVNQIRATNGSLWVSDAIKLANVVKESANSYKCFINTDDGTIYVPFKVDDIVRCQVWNGKGIKYYTAKVTAIKATLQDQYFHLSVIEGSNEPAEGDDVVRIGSLSDKNRQGALYLTASDNGAPYMDVLDGVNSASFAGKVKIRLGKLDGIVDPELGQLSGYGLYGIDTYLKGKFIVQSGSNVYNKSETGTQIQAGVNTANDYTNTQFAVLDGKIESKVSTQQMNAAIANIRVGGSNLLVNSNSGLIFVEADGSTISRQYNQTVAGFDFPVTIANTTGGTTTTKSVADLYTPKNNEEVSVSGSFKNLGNNPITFKLNLSNETFVLASQEAKRLAWEGVKGDGVRALRISVVTASVTTNLSFGFSRLQVEYGNKSTEWNLSPTDVSDGLLSTNNRITSAETRIQQNANEIALRATKTEVETTVNTKIDDIIIGATNFLDNSGNFNSVQGWTTYGTAASVSYNPDTKRIRAVYLSANARLYNTTYIPLMTYSEEVTITLRYISTQNILRIGGKYRNISGGESSTWEGTLVKNIDGDVKTAIYKYTTKPKTDNDNLLFLYIWMNTNQTLEVVNIQYEKGNKSTNWTPSANDILNYRLGTSNMLPDSRLRRPEIYPTGTTQGSLSITQNKPSNIVRVTKTGATNVAIGVQNSTTDTFEVTAGNIYTISFDLRASGLTSLQYNYLMRVDGANNKIIDNIDFTTWNISSSTFRRVTSTFIAPWTSKQAYIMLAYIGTETGWFEITNIKFEIGSKTTDWSISPQDIDKEVGDVTTRVTNAETSIIQNAEQIELRATKTELTQAISNVAISGLNLFSFTYTSLNTYPNASNNSLISVRFPVKQNVNYTLSTDIPKGGTGSYDLFFGIWPSIPSSASNGVAANEPRTINTGNNGFVEITFRNYDMLGQLILGNTHIQLEVGTVANPWTANTNDLEYLARELVTITSQQETKITQNAEQIELRATKQEVETTVIQAVEKVKIGGYNYQEDITIGYYVSGGVISDVNNKGLTVTYNKTHPTTPYIFFQKLNEMQLNIDHILSFWIKASTEDITKTNITVAFGVRGTGTSDDVRSIKKDEWTKIEFTFKPTIIGGQVIIFPNNNQHPDGIKFEIKELKVEQGNKSTDWTPNPSDIKVGGRNGYSNNILFTPVTAVNGGGVSARNTVTCPNGFSYTGASGAQGGARLGKVITGNGWWTVSGWVRGNQTTPISFEISIANSIVSPRIISSNNNTWTYFSYSANVISASSTVDFVDFLKASYHYFFFKDIKVEQGNKATDWSPDPRDTDEAILQVNTRVTNAETKITQNSEQIELRATKTEVTTSVNNAVNNLQVGSVNLLPATKTVPALNIKTTQEFTAKGWAQVIWNNDVIGKLVAGKIYTMTFTAQITAVGSGTVTGKQVGFAIYANTGFPTQLLYATDLVNLNQKGTYTFTFVAPDVSVSNLYRMLFYTNYRTTTTNTDTVKFTDVKLEEGQKSTTWSPAIEDTQGQIDSMTTRITTAETKITQNAEQIELRATKTEVTTSVNNGIAGITLGIRNILLDSSKSFSKLEGDGKYLVGSYNVVRAFSPLAVNKKFTLVVKGSNSGAGNLGVWVNGSQALGTIISNESNVVKTMVFTRNSVATIGTNISFYHAPQGSAGTSSVEWAVLYEGDITKPSLDWVPAPEDTDAKVTILDTKITNQETRITQNAEQIELRATKQEVTTEVNNRFDSLNIGGENIANSGGGGNNYLQSFWYTNTDFNLFDKITISGKQWLRRKATAGSTRIAATNGLLEGQEYTWSFDAFVETGTATLRFANYSGSSYNVKDYLINSSAKRFYHTFTVKAGATGDIPHLTVPEGVHVANFQLEKGNKGTDWKPSAKDNEAVFDGISSRITNAETKITQNTQQIQLRATKDEVSQAIANIQIGGGNLLLNSGNFKNTIGYDNTWSVVTKDGYKTLRTTGTTSRQLNTTRLKADTEYTFSTTIMLGTAFTASNTTPLHFWLKKNTGSNTSGLQGTPTSTHTGQVIPANTWVTIVTKFKTATGTNTDTFEFTPIIYTNTTSIEKWMQWWQLEEGNINTSWKPNPLDMQGEIDGLTTRVTNAEAAITVNAEQIELRATKTEVTNTVNTTVNSAINNLSIGGTNLYPNSNSGALFSGYSGSTLTKTNDVVVTEWGATDAHRVVSSGGNNAIKAIQAIITIPNGKTVTQSIWIKNNSTNKLQVYSNMGARSTVLEPNQQMRIVWTSIVGNGVGSLQFQMRPYSSTGTANDPNGVVDFTWWRIKLEDGDKATDWSPDPRDIDTQITNVNTRVTNAETRITQNSEQIELRATKTEVEKSMTSNQVGGVNLIIKTKEELNKIMNDGGVITTYGYNNLSDYINVASGVKYTLWKDPNNPTTSADNYFRVGYFDINKTFISRVISTSNEWTITIPSNAVYARVSHPNDIRVKMERGEIFTGYSIAPEDLAAMQLGGRNLFIKSDRQVENATYQMTAYNFGGIPVAGRVYTVTLWGELGSDRQRFTLFNSGGSIYLGSLIKIQDGVYQSTFTWVNAAPNGTPAVPTPSYVNLYQALNNGTSVSKVYRIKLEEGARGTDWTPAPEDVDAQITTINTTISNHETRITQNANEITLRATKTEVTNQINTAVAGIQTGGTNFLSLQRFNSEKYPNASNASLLSYKFIGTPNTNYTLSNTLTATYDMWLGVFPSVPSSAGGGNGAGINKPMTVNSGASGILEVTIRNQAVLTSLLNGTHNAQLELGSKATNWNPNTYDVTVGLSTLTTRVTNAETRITQNAEQIELRATKTEVETSVTTGIKNIKLGIYNYQPDITKGYYTSGATINEVNDNRYIKATYNKSGSTPYIYVDSLDAFENGNNFILSFWVRATCEDSATTTLRVQYGVRNAGANNDIISTIAVNTWVKIERVYTTLLTYNGLGTRIILFTNDFAKGVTLEFKDIMFQEGNKATDWVANPKDSGMFGGTNLVPQSNNLIATNSGTGVTTTNNADGSITINNNYSDTLRGYTNPIIRWTTARKAWTESQFIEGEDFVISFLCKSDTVGAKKPEIYIKPALGYRPMSGNLGSNYSLMYATAKWIKTGDIQFHIGTYKGVYTISNLKLEKGTKPTDWSPSPLDTQEQFTEVNTKFTEQDTRITQNSQQIELRATKTEVTSQINSSVSTAVDNITLGGRNYLGTTGFSIYAQYYTGTLVSGLLTAKRVSATTQTLVFSVVGFNNTTFLKGQFTFSGFLKVNNAIPATVNMNGVLNTQGGSRVGAVKYDSTTGYLEVTHNYTGNSVWFLHSNLFTMVNNGDTLTIDKVKFEKGNKATDWTPSEEDLDATISTINTTLISQDARITTNANQIALRVTKTEMEGEIKNITDIKDTRSVNSTPEWYFQNYPMKTVREFKYLSTIGQPVSGQTYGQLITYVPWSGLSGGHVVQELTVVNKLFSRSGTTTTWSAWTEGESTDGAQAKATLAENNSKTYTNSQITILDNKISLKSDKTVTDNLVTRMSSAEAKITPDAINLTVKSQVNSKDTGKMLFRDTNFLNGNNGLVKYDNANSATAVLSRENVTGGSQPTGTPWRLKYTVTGSGTSPNWGGWRWGFQSRANAIFNVKFIALIPVGRTLEFGTNATGSGGTHEWLTDNKGTGKFTEYVHQIRCGSTGTFSTTGFYSVAGGATPTASAPLVCYIAFATVMDLSNVDDTPTVEEIQTSFTMTNNTISLMGKNIEMTGKITFNSLDSDSQNRVNTANSNANTAIGTANTANSTANTANNTANAANGTANNALSTANSANSAAGTANTNANNAVNTANSANSTANTANNTANAANGTANTALNTANAVNGTVENWRFPNQTTIDGGKIQTRTVTAEQINVDNLYVRYLSSATNDTEPRLLAKGGEIGFYANKASETITTNAMVRIGVGVGFMQSNGFNPKPGVSVRDNGQGGDGSYSELSSEGIFSNGSNISALSATFGIKSSMTIAGLLQTRVSGSISGNSINAAIFGFDQTYDTTAAYSEGYAAYFIGNVKIDGSLINSIGGSNSNGTEIPKHVSYYQVYHDDTYMPNNVVAGHTVTIRNNSGGTRRVRAQVGSIFYFGQNGQNGTVKDIFTGTTWTCVYDGGNWVVY